MTLRWGILGAGIIAHRLADAVRREAGHELVTVASKTPAKAREFAVPYGIRAAADYDDLVADETVDVVYVATTHNFHHACARLALEHGKHVLVEKPFTVNAREADDLIALARSRGLFLMEAMWSRFLPTWAALEQTVHEGGIGEVRQIDVSFGGIVPPHYELRLKDPALAGGATLDMGVYPISFVCHVLGDTPRDVESMMQPNATGVDELACMLFRFPSGCLATIRTSFDLFMPWRATLYGTTGFVDYPNFQRADTFHLHRHGGTGEVTSVVDVERPHEENGFVYQVREVGRRIAAGETESPVMPLDESREILRLIDGMRAEWGLRYPFE